MYRAFRESPSDTVVVGRALKARKGTVPICGGRTFEIEGTASVRALGQEV